MRNAHTGVSVARRRIDLRARSGAPSTRRPANRSPDLPGGTHGHGIRRVRQLSVEAIGWVWRHSPYTGDSLLVHLAIADVVNDTYGNEFWMTTQALADKARCSRSTTVATLKRMLDAGLLTIVERGGGRGKPTRYVFEMTSSTPLWTTPETDQISRSIDDVKLRDRDDETARSAAPIRDNSTGTQEPKAERNPQAVENLRSRFKTGRLVDE